MNDLNTPNFTHPNLAIKNHSIFKNWKYLLVPHNFTIVKGIAYCSFSRRFIDYALNSLYSRNLLDWAKDTYSPDEWFWATLNYNVQFNPPGGFRGNTFKV